MACVSVEALEAMSFGLPTVRLVTGVHHLLVGVPLGANLNILLSVMSAG